MNPQEALNVLTTASDFPADPAVKEAAEALQRLIDSIRWEEELRAYVIQVKP